MPAFPDGKAPDPLNALQQQRVKIMLWVTGAALICIGIGWGIFFSLNGYWLQVAMDGIVIAVGLTIFRLVHTRQLSAAFALMVASVYVLVVLTCLYFDLPTAAAPRSTHLFLLPMGMCVFLYWREAPGLIRPLVAGLCFVTCLVLASSDVALSDQYGLPDSIRIGGTWVNNGLAIGLTFVLLHIMMSDIAIVSSLESDIRRGMNQGEFILVYQPQVSSKGAVVGAEALLRWQHPKRGLLGPAEFIAMAEQSGLIVRMGLESMEAACRLLVDLGKMPSSSHLTVSVNVSARQLRQPDFVSSVEAILKRTGVPENRLKLELTESLLVHDMDDIVQKMTALRPLGVGFSLDDFGTGYSSLSYLKRLPLDQLKIDQSFVRDVLTDANDAAIARTVISLGKSLGFAVIAEGVETEGQRDFLARNDCHFFQGYLFSRPLPEAQFRRYVAA